MTLRRSRKISVLAHPSAPLVALVVLMGGGWLANYLDADRQQRQGIARSSALSQVQQRLELQANESLSELAQSRYQGRCVLVEGAAIAAGMALADSEGRPLADGTTVCDAHGNTAVMARGVTTHVASTSNASVIHQFLGWK